LRGLFVSKCWGLPPPGTPRSDSAEEAHLFGWGNLHRREPFSKALARAIGDPSTFGFLTMTTRPIFRADFKLGEGGKTAVYMARPPRRICDWINTRGEKGLWSEIATAALSLARTGGAGGRQTPAFANRSGWKTATILRNHC